MGIQRTGRERERERERKKEREREREREREQQINGVSDGALVRNRNGVGQKWPLVKLNTRVF